MIKYIFRCLDPQRTRRKNKSFTAFFYISETRYSKPRSFVKEKNNNKVLRLVAQQQIPSKIVA
jgi:hypothetical protein